MSVYDADFQQSILTAVEQEERINSAIISDIIDEHLERKCFMEYLDRRSRRLAATNWKEDQLSTEADGVPIFDREFESSLKVNHRLHNDFINRITSTFTGYMGNEPSIKWDERDIAQTLIDQAGELIKDFRKINNINTVYHELLCYAVKEGNAGLLLYNSEAMPKVKVLPPWEFVVIKNPSTDETEFAMRYWKVIERILDMSGNMTKTEVTMVEWYDKKNIYHYISDGEGNYKLDDINFPAETKTAPNEESYTTLPGIEMHFFDGVPVVEFPKNKDRIGDVEKSLELQDAYDISLSDFSSENAQFRLAYLLIRNLGQNIDDEFLDLLKQTGIISVDVDGSAEWLAKTINIESVKLLQETLKENIFLFSNSVDFSSKDFSGNMPIIAFELKTKPLEESATETELYMKKALYEMYTLLANYWKLRDNFDFPVNSISWVFTRNLPVNMVEKIDNFVKLKGQVSDETALAQLPFIDDVEEEIERIENQRQAEDERLMTVMDNNINQEENTENNDQSGQTETE